MCCIIAALNSTTGSVLGLPLSALYSFPTMSYIFVKSTVSSIFRSRWFSGTRSSMQIISLWLLSFCSLLNIFITLFYYTIFT